MAYRLHYSDYPGTAEGPPDPERWVGPPGPMGPPGPQGVPGPLPPGAPFLPLSGGTVTGNVDIGATLDATTIQTYNHRTQTGGTFNTALGIYGDLSGTVSGGNPFFATVNLLNDTAAAGGGGLTTLYVTQNSGGTGTTGNRVGAYINFKFTGGTTNKGLGIGGNYGGLWSYATASGNVGGTTGAGNSWGELWGGISSATLASGATFWNACIGHEVDFGVSTGASAPYVQGLKIVLAHHNQPIQTTDYMIGMAKITLTDTNLGNGIAFGSIDGYWPFANTSTLIGTQASNLPTPPPMTAAMGIDFNAVTFGSAAFRSPGFVVSPAGAVTAAYTTTSGLNLGQNAAASITDLSKHISLYDPIYGINVTGGFINYVAPSSAVHNFVVNGVSAGAIGATGLNACAVGQTTRAAGSFTTLSTTGFSVDVSGNLLAASLTTGGGLNHGASIGASITDLSKHIQLYNPSGTPLYGINITGGFINYVVPTGAAHQFVVNGVVVGSIGVSGVMTGAAGGPTWTTGSAAPAATAPVGSLYSRVGGAVGATLYVSRGGGTWAAVAGV